MVERYEGLTALSQVAVLSPYLRNLETKKLCPEARHKLQGETER
jgi:hypothetical protein